MSANRSPPSTAGRFRRRAKWIDPRRVDRQRRGHGGGARDQERDAPEKQACRQRGDTQSEPPELDARPAPVRLRREQEHRVDPRRDPQDHRRDPAEEGHVKVGLHGREDATREHVAAVGDGQRDAEPDRQREPREPERETAGGERPARHRPKGQRDVDHVSQGARAHQRGRPREARPSPGPEVADHPDDARDERRQLPARETLAPERPLDRDRDQLVARPQDRQRDPARARRRARGRGAAGGSSAPSARRRGREG